MNRCLFAAMLLLAWGWPGRLVAQCPSFNELVHVDCKDLAPVQILLDATEADHVPAADCAAAEGPGRAIRISMDDCPGIAWFDLDWMRSGGPSSRLMVQVLQADCSPIADLPGCFRLEAEVGSQRVPLLDYPDDSYVVYIWPENGATAADVGLACPENCDDPSCDLDNDEMTICDTDCPTLPGERECTDGIDNDCDGVVDFEDSECPERGVREVPPGCNCGSDGGDEASRRSLFSPAMCLLLFVPVLIRRGARRRWLLPVTALLCCLPGAAAAEDRTLVLYISDSLLEDEEKALDLLEQRYPAIRESTELPEILPAAQWLVGRGSEVVIDGAQSTRRCPPGPNDDPLRALRDIRSRLKQVDAMTSKQKAATMNELKQMLYRLPCREQYVESDQLTALFFLLGFLETKLGDGDADFAVGERFFDNALGIDRRFRVDEWKHIVEGETFRRSRAKFLDDALPGQARAGQAQVEIRFERSMAETLLLDGQSPQLDEDALGWNTSLPLYAGEHLFQWKQSRLMRGMMLGAADGQRIKILGPTAQADALLAASQDADQNAVAFRILNWAFRGASNHSYEQLKSAIPYEQIIVIDFRGDRSAADAPATRIEVLSKNAFNIETLAERTAARVQNNLPVEADDRLRLLLGPGTEFIDQYGYALLSLDAVVSLRRGLPVFVDGSFVIGAEFKSLRAMFKPGVQPTTLLVGGALGAGAYVYRRNGQAAFFSLRFRVKGDQQSVVGAQPYLAPGIALSAGVDSHEAAPKMVALRFRVYVGFDGLRLTGEGDDGALRELKTLQPMLVGGLRLTVGLRIPRR